MKYLFSGEGQTLLVELQDDLKYKHQDIYFVCI